MSTARKSLKVKCFFRLGGEVIVVFSYTNQVSAYYFKSILKRNPTLFVITLLLLSLTQLLQASDGRTQLPNASISRECLALFPALVRGKVNFGGFAKGMTPQEMAEIAIGLSTEQHVIFPLPGKSFEQVLINASYRNSFWEKLGTVIRDIAGSHLLNDANHRMAFIVSRRLIERNGILRNQFNSDERLAEIISKTARKSPGFTTPEEIAQKLRGY